MLFFLHRGLVASCSCCLLITITGFKGASPGLAAAWLVLFVLTAAGELVQFAVLLGEQDLGLLKLLGDDLHAGLERINTTTLFDAVIQEAESLSAPALGSEGKAIEEALDVLHGVVVLDSTAPVVVPPDVDVVASEHLVVWIELAMGKESQVTIGIKNQNQNKKVSDEDDGLNRWLMVPSQRHRGLQSCKYAALTQGA